MTNPKIEKVKANIAKTKAIIADYQVKLKDLERQKIQLENDEIVALFRRENLNEDEFAAILRSGKKEHTEVGGQAQGASGVKTDELISASSVKPAENSDRGKEENFGDNA